MNYHEKLRAFFKSKGLSQVDVSKKIPYSQVMVSRYLNSNFPNYEFITHVSKAWPDIDWNYILKDGLTVINDAGETLQKTPKKILEDIQNSVELLKDWHKNDTK